MGKMLVSALVLVALSTAALAQDSMTIAPDFEKGQVYRYAGKFATTAPSPSGEGVKLEGSMAFEMEILSVDEETFTLTSRITRFAVEGGELVYPEGPVPEPSRRFFDALNAVQYTYDRQWRLVRVRGLSSIFEPLLEALPQGLRDRATKAIDRALGRLLLPISRRAGRGASNLFEGGVTRDERWAGTSRFPGLGALSQEMKVAGFETIQERQAATIEFEQEFEAGPLLALTGFREQETEGTLSILANGMAGKARYVTEQVMPTGTTKTEAEFDLVEIARK